MARVAVAWDDAAIRMDCASPATPVGRGLARLADKAVLEMKQRIPVGKPQTGPLPGHPRQVARRPGTLRSSVRKIRQGDGSYLIGPTDTVNGQLLGPLIEHGTRPHVIRSHGPWPLYSTTTGRRYGRPVHDGGRLAYWEVHHPGTRAQPFIDPAARALGGTVIRIS